MEDKFYTINQVAEILDMHHKTIRNFIAERKLRASKVGKQWRISDEDLDSFMGNKKEHNEGDAIVEFFSNEVAVKQVTRRINVSTVLDIEQIDKDEYLRLSNTLIAILNGRNDELQKSTINMKYYEKENKCKVLLWGNIGFIEEILSTISMLVESENTSSNKNLLMYERIDII